MITNFPLLWFQMIQQNRRPRQAFVDSETETEFTEITLSPKEENSNSSSRPSSRRQALFQKRNRSPGSGTGDKALGGVATNNSSGSNQFHSLPHTSINKTSSNFGQVSSWEANNLMEEMTTHNSHIIHAVTAPTVRLASNMVPGSNPTSTMELDSLSNRLSSSNMVPGSNPIIAEEDSLNFDLQEIDEEDSLTPDEHFYEHDSLQPVVKPILKQQDKPHGPGFESQQQQKKLIIPYNESFSSTTSIFTTSQDGSLDSCTKNQTEEDSLTQSNPNLTLNMVPIKPWQPTVVATVPATIPPPVATPVINHYPKIIGPEYQQQNGPPPAYVHNQIHLHNPYHHSQQIHHQQTPHHPPVTIVRPPNNLVSQPTSAQAATMVVPAQSSPSLMKMATERMKRKFLGWS